MIMMMVAMMKATQLNEENVSKDEGINLQDIRAQEMQMGNGEEAAGKKMNLVAGDIVLK